MSAYRWVETGLDPLVGRAVSRGVPRCDWVQEVFRQPVCSCSFVVWPEVFPALDPTGCWVEPGLGAKISASGRAHTDECSLIYLPCTCAQSCSTLRPRGL